MIKKYVLVVENRLDDFNASVNARIDEGYQPFESPTLTSHGRYCQAMVQYTDSTKSTDIGYTLFAPDARDGERAFVERMICVSNATDGQSWETRYDGAEERMYAAAREVVNSLA